MSTASLRPVLRPSTLPSLPFQSIVSQPSTTYICQSCRHARLLRRPKRPYTFTQLVALSDGSAFTMRTTSPMPVYRSTRDTRNAALWNPSSKELLSIEDDEAGRLAGFRARFGTSFDGSSKSVSGLAASEDSPAQIHSDESMGEIQEAQPTTASGGKQQDPFFRQATETRHANAQSQAPDDEEYYEFEEDDANLLDLISSYGQEVKGPKAKDVPAPGAGKKGKK